MDVNVLARAGLDARRRSRPGSAATARARWSTWPRSPGIAPAPGIAYYGVSKAALIGLTVQLAAELAPGVRVNAIAPAVVKTQFAAALYEADEAGAAAIPAGPARACRRTSARRRRSWLGRRAWITGQTLVVDGGGGLRASL